MAQAAHQPAQGEVIGRRRVVQPLRHDRGGHKFSHVGNRCRRQDLLKSPLVLSLWRQRRPHECLGEKPSRRVDEPLPNSALRRLRRLPGVLDLYQSSHTYSRYGILT